MSVIYLSGQMTGLPDYGAATFKKYAERYRAEGYTVISPSEQDTRHPAALYREYIRRDLYTMLMQASRVYLLPNWIYSKGAVCERVVAETVGIPVYDAETGEELTDKMELWDRRKNMTRKVPQIGAHHDL